MHKKATGAASVSSASNAAVHSISLEARASDHKSGTSAPPPSVIRALKALFIAAVCRRMAAGGPTALPRMVVAPSLFMPMRGSVFPPVHDQMPFTMASCMGHKLRVRHLLDVDPRDAGSGEGGLKVTRSLLSPFSRTEPPVSQRPNSAGAGDWGGCDPVAWIPEIIP